MGWWPYLTLTLLILWFALLAVLVMKVRGGEIYKIQLVSAPAGGVFIREREIERHGGVTKAMGRRPIGDRPMTNAERQRFWRGRHPLQAVLNRLEYRRRKYLRLRQERIAAGTLAEDLDVPVFDDDLVPGTDD